MFLRFLLIWEVKNLRNLAGIELAWVTEEYGSKGEWVLFKAAPGGKKPAAAKGTAKTAKKPAAVKKAKKKKKKQQ